MPLDLYRKDQIRRGLAPSTIEQYEARLRRFRRWLGRPITTATEADVQAWLDSCRLGPNSRRTTISTLAAFYQWATRHGWARTDPTADIVRPKRPRRLPRPMAAHDLAWALRGADDRMRAWLLLAALQGLRCVEIANLRGEDVLDDQDPPMLFVTGKGDRDRVLPLNPAVEDALRAHGIPRRGPIFTGRDGQPIAPGTVSHYIARYLHAQGIAATAHKGRHAFATAVYQETHDLLLTQQLLGHSSPATTAVYAATNPSDAVPVVRGLCVPPADSVPSCQQGEGDERCRSG